MHNQRRTVNIHTGRKLSGKSRDEILEAVLSCFSDYNIHCVQQFFDLIRVTFDFEATAVSVLKERGVRLFGIWCRMDGGPPTTIVHLFDYPYEEDEESVSDFFGTFGTVKSVRCQKYISHSKICTGTRLLDLVMTEMPPCQVNIKGYICRVWFKGQPLVCNLCSGKGHRAADCPNKDRCRLCGKRDHFARNCPNPWNNRGTSATASSEDNTSSDQAVDVADGVASSSGAPPRPPAARGPGSGVVVVEGTMSSGDVLDSVASGVTGVGVSGSAEADSNGAGVEPMSAEAAVSDVGRVLNGLFASDDDDDDGDDVDDGNDADGSRVDITEFTSVSEFSSQNISQFTDDSQSILRNVPNMTSNSSTLAKDNSSSGNFNDNGSKENVVSVSKSAPDPKTVSSKITVVTIVDGDDVENDNGFMDISSGSRKRKDAPRSL